MNYFRHWIKTKYFTEAIILEGSEIRTGNIPEQMLIGYMIEYCIEHEIKFHIDYSSSVNKIFDYLKKKIDRN